VRGFEAGDFRVGDDERRESVEVEHRKLEAKHRKVVDLKEKGPRRDAINSQSSLVSRASQKENKYSMTRREGKFASARNERER
jgi:hypothetical protein